MPNLIIDYLKRSCSAPLSTKEPSSYCRNIFVSTNWIWCSNRKKKTHKRGKIHKRRQRRHSNTMSLWSWLFISTGTNCCQASWFKSFSWLHCFQEKNSGFCMFYIKHKGKWQQIIIRRKLISRRGFINGRKLLKHLLITNNLKHIELQLHMNLWCLNVVIDVLEIMVNDLNNKCLAEKSTW